MRYRELGPLDKIVLGDEFSWKNKFDDGEEDWYPCETFVGRRIKDIRSNVSFRRPAIIAEELAFAS
jgi:hypothetical protein